MLQIVKTFYSAFILLCLSFSLQAQSCEFTLSGSVQDKDGNKLPGATLLFSGKSVATTADGEFVFNQVCAGTGELTVRYIGFDNYKVQLSLTGNKRITITLRSSETVLDAVEISDASTPSGLTNSTYTLSSEELEHFNGKSLGEALKRVPGVTALQTGPAIFKPVIDGLHSQRILILNNGIRQEGQQWGIEHAPEIDPFIASQIKVVKGSEAVRYGSDAIGGVIIVDTPPMHQAQTLGGELNTGFFSNNRMGVFSGMLEGGIKKWRNASWRIQSSAKKGGDYSTPHYVLSNTGVEELNFSGAFALKDNKQGFEIYFSSFNTEIGILRAAHTGSLEDLDNSIRQQRPWYIKDFTYDINVPRQQINHQLLKVSAFKNISGVGKLNVLYGGQYNQRKEFDIRRAGRSGEPALSLDLLSNVLDVFLDHTIRGVQGSVGVNGTFKNNSNVPGTNIRPLIPNYQQFNAGIFLLEKYRKNKWLFEAGVRWDHQYLKVITFINNQDLVKPSFNFNYVSGSIGASYYINEFARFSSHLGVATRPPHVSELYSEGLHHGTAAIEQGLMHSGTTFLTDQDLIKQEISSKFTNSIQIIRKTFSLEVAAYVNHISNYVFLKPTGTALTIRGYFPVFQYEQTEALLSGIDGMIHWDIFKHLEYSGSFAYLYAKDITRNDVLIFIPPPQMEHAFTYSLTTKRKQDVFFTVSVPIGFKQTRAPITVYPTDVPSYTGSAVFDFAPAPGAYALLNAAMGIKLPLKEHDLSISLSGENILNRSYRVYMNRLRYFADEPGSNFSIRIKYSFHSHS
jgi:iron complex outermembrane recepter protein